MSAKGAREIGYECYKVRIFIGGGTIFVISETEPKVQIDKGSIRGLEWKPIFGSEHGDTLGFIRWEEVSAISWRKAEESAVTTNWVDARVCEYRSLASIRDAILSHLGDGTTESAKKIAKAVGYVESKVFLVLSILVSENLVKELYKDQAMELEYCLNLENEADDVAF